jgi:lysophospholipase L1-like esterase
LAKHKVTLRSARATGTIVILSVTCIVLLVALVVVASSPSKVRSDPPAPAPTYDVALGDSISYGDYASSPLTSFVGVLYQHEEARYPGLQLANFACGSQATEDMIYGSDLCDYSVVSQLGHATAFLRAHKGQVRFVTIDIGINDMVHGESGRQLFLRLLHILVTIKHTDPGVHVYGMNYYDPFLGNPATTPAWGTPADFAQLNSTVAGAYLYNHDTMVNAVAAFGTNPARLCALTFQCDEPPAQNIHPNDTGYAVLAKAFEVLIDKG